MKEEILSIASDLREGHITSNEAKNLLLVLFGVSVDPLDDENSEIHKIGREIAEMSDEEFEANCKSFERLINRSKGNDL